MNMFCSFETARAARRNKYDIMHWNFPNYVNWESSFCIRNQLANFVWIETIDQWVFKSKNSYFASGIWADHMNTNGQPQGVYAYKHSTIFSFCPWKYHRAMFWETQGLPRYSLVQGLQEQNINTAASVHARAAVLRKNFSRQVRECELEIYALSSGREKRD